MVLVHISQSGVIKNLNRDKGGMGMAKVLIAYISRTGHTKKMAEYIAEGIRACQDYGKAIGQKFA